MLEQPQRQARRRKPLFLSILLLALLLGSVWGWWGWQGAIHASVLEQGTYQFTAVTGQPDPGRHEVQGRWIGAQSPAQSVLLYAPGVIPAQRAVGQLLFLNNGSVPVTVATTTLIGKSGMAITFNGPLTIPAMDPLVAVITGFTVSSAVGALPAFDLDQRCCAAGVVVKNAAFHQASGGPLSSTLSQSSIAQETRALSQASVFNLPPQLDLQRTLTERVVAHSFQCVPQPLPTFSRTRSVVIQVTVACQEALYNQAQALSLAQTLLVAQASHDLGSGSVPAGPLAIQIISATLTSTHQIVVSVQAEGTWTSHA